MPKSNSIGDDKNARRLTLILKKLLQNIFKGTKEDVKEFGL
jgi:hypothetical protein